MAFIDEIKNEMAKIDRKREVVIDHIMNYFEKQLVSEEFEDKLKERLLTDYNNNRKTEIRIQFNHYSLYDIRIEVDCCNTWVNPMRNKKTFVWQDVDLYSIKNIVDAFEQSNLVSIYVRRLKQLGLSYEKRSLMCGGTIVTINI